MAAFRLARRERPKLANAALQPLKRACHSLRAAPCLDPFGKLCILTYNLEGVLGLRPKKRHSALLVVHLEPPNLTPRALIGPFWGSNDAVPISVNRP